MAWVLVKNSLNFASLSSKILLNSYYKGLSPMKIKILEHQNAWLEDFEQEKASLNQQLHDIWHEIHHIGSTAVKGLHAKPIIDILLLVESLSELDDRPGVIEYLGYEALGEFGIPGRRYYRKTNEAGEHTHHIHAFLRESPEARRHLAFRDYLGYNPEATQQYSRLKLSLVAANPYNIEAYAKGKEPFITRVEAEALAWYDKKGL